MRAVTLLCVLLGCGQLYVEAIDASDVGDAGGTDSTSEDATFVDAFVDVSADSSVDTGVDAFDVGADSVDADSVDAADAGADAADAAIVRPLFGAPVLLGELSADGFDADDPTLTADLLEIHFKTQRLVAADIWVASRTAIGESFSPPSPALGLETVGVQDTPEILADGRTLYFTASPTSSQTDVFRVTRADRTSAWGAAVLVDALNSSSYEFGACSDATETHIVFSRFVLSPRNHSLFQSRRPSRDVDWSVPEPIGEFDTDGFELDAYLSANGLVVYFGRGSDTGPAEEIFRAERPSVDDSFEAPVQLVELSSAGSDTDPWVSADERVLVFTSDRSGRNEIYVATREGGRF